ncbi:hypothetical protein [Peribacillus frigoritolerans]|nr:hypothetical protein [Peribacillus frigoritolerans]
MELNKGVSICVFKLEIYTKGRSGKRCRDAGYEGIANISYKNHIEADSI